MMRSVNFLLTLAAVVAATLLVTPLPAVAETEAPNPPSVTPSEVERTPVGVAGPAPSAVCGVATTVRSTTTDIDPDCIDGCERDRTSCLNAARTRYERSVCYTEFRECDDRCFAGELDPDRSWYNPWNPSMPPDEAPRGGAVPRDSERPRRPNPHHF